VPIRDIDGQFLGAQSIDVSGKKSLPRGCREQGGHHGIEDASTSDKILFAEGYATAATLHELTDLPVVVTFDSGNMPGVAEVTGARKIGPVECRDFPVACDQGESRNESQSIHRREGSLALKSVARRLLLFEKRFGSERLEKRFRNGLSIPSIWPTVPLLQITPGMFPGFGLNLLWLRR
jgi:hypothetical protein